jgi:hypothetical protein
MQKHRDILKNISMGTSKAAILYLSDEHLKQLRAKRFNL